MTIALITGANKGIGLATAQLLGARGMTVLIGSRDENRGEKAQDALRKDGIDAVAVRLDVTDADSISHAADWIAQRYGQLDVLINNAGIARGDGSGLPTETTLETLRAVYETNVFGVVAMTNAVVPMLLAAPAGRIVNVSSEVGSITGMTDPDSPLFPIASISYPSSKTALNMVTAMYAKQFRDTPVKVNAANPGYCATDLNGHNGFRTPEQGAEVSVHLATLGDDGPTGVLWGHVATATGEVKYDVLPW